jgi:hypothetical protein
MRRYILEMSEEQADIVKDALEFYSRILIGQWQELGYKCLDMKDKDYPSKMNTLKRGLATLRPLAFPELPADLSASYGVTSRVLPCRTWEIYTVLRYRLAWTKHPEGGMARDYDEPVNYSSKPLPKCEVKSVENA